MPTLDDAPTIPVLLGAEDLTAAEGTAVANVYRGDILQVYDVSAQRPKTITVQELGEALGLTFA
tara:strand:- start:404 stop:595 length:192 start_codon:yes stop_codon:yes gene_type:complete